MKKYFRLLTSLLLFLAILQNAMPCGPSYLTPVFDYKYAPENPFENFAAGKIGIVKPSYHRTILVAAYRYLTGGNFTPDEQKNLIEVWKADFNNEDFNKDDSSEAVKKWVQKRLEVVGKDEKTPDIYVEREYGGYNFFPNCTPNAFETAAQTLASRISSYGADSKDVKSWVKAQDAVFSNCASGREIPAPLVPGAAQWLQKDFDYQAAAAEFYSLNYTEAKNKFALIAVDNESPWQETADYLVGRTLLREASLTKSDEKSTELYRQAETQLQNISTRGGKFAASSDKLLGLIKYRLHPQDRIRELAQRLTFEQGNVNFRQDLIDYSWLLDKFQKETLEALEKRHEAEKLAAEGNNANTATNQTNDDAQKEEDKHENELTIYLFEEKTGKSWTVYISPNATDEDAIAEAEKVVGLPLTEDQKKSVRESRLAGYTSRFSGSRQPEYQGGYFGVEKPQISILPEFLRQDDLTDWLYTFQFNSVDAYLHAVSKFKTTGADIWLTAALNKAGKNSSDLDYLLEAAARSDHHSRAYPTIGYHAARIYLELGKTAEADKILDEMLDSTDEMPISTVNQLRQMRSRTTAALDEYLKFSLRKPFAFDYDGVSGTVEDFIAQEKSYYDPTYNKESKADFDREVEERYASRKLWQDRLMFDTDTTETFNQYFPVSVLIEAEKSPELPEYLRGEFALAIWTRSALLGDAVSMRQIMPELIKYQPEMEQSLNKIETSATPAQRQNAILYFILKNPVLTPFIESPLDKSDNTTDTFDSNDWWCAPYDIEPSDGGSTDYAPPPKPKFINAVQINQAKAEREKLKSLGEASNYLGGKVSDWAKRSPNDKRIPESLYLVYEANGWKKYSCGGDEELRKTTGDLLKTRYADSEWTKKILDEEKENQ